MSALSPPLRDRLIFTPVKPVPATGEMRSPALVAVAVKLKSGFAGKVGFAVGVLLTLREKQCIHI